MGGERRAMAEWRAHWRVAPECRMVKRQSTRFLNRVRKFDSCRGHSPEIDLEAGLALLTA